MLLVLNIMKLVISYFCEIIFYSYITISKTSLNQFQDSLRKDDNKREKMRHGRGLNGHNHP